MPVARARSKARRSKRLGVVSAAKRNARTRVVRHPPARLIMQRQPASRKPKYTPDAAARLRPLDAEEAQASSASLGRVARP